MRPLGDNESNRQYYQLASQGGDIARLWDRVIFDCFIWRTYHGGYSFNCRDGIMAAIKVSRALIPVYVSL